MCDVDHVVGGDIGQRHQSRGREGGERHQLVRAACAAVLPVELPDDGQRGPFAGGRLALRPQPQAARSHIGGLEPVQGARVLLLAAQQLETDRVLRAQAAHHRLRVQGELDDLGLGQQQEDLLQASLHPAGDAEVLVQSRAGLQLPRVPPDQARDLGETLAVLEHLGQRDQAPAYHGTDQPAPRQGEPQRVVDRGRRPAEVNRVVQVPAPRVPGRQQGRQARRRVQAGDVGGLERVGRDPQQAGAPARLADGQRGRHRVLPGRDLLAAAHLDQQPHCERADVLQRLPHARQAGGHPGPGLVVVKADHREVVRQVETGVRKRPGQADGVAVVAGKHCGRRHFPLQHHARGALPARLLHVVHDEQQIRVRRQAVVGHRLPVRVDALVDVRVSRKTDIPDSGVTVVDQVLGRRAGAGEVVGQDDRAVEAGRNVTDHDDGAAAVPGRPQIVGAHAVQDDDEATHIVPGHVVREGRRLGEVLLDGPGVDGLDRYHLAACGCQFRRDPGHQFTEVRPAERGGQDADVEGVRLAQHPSG